MNTLAQLAAAFGILSLLAVGGGAAVLPEMKETVVGQYHWLTADQFVHIYSLGQIAPGPNMLMVQIIGERIAGGAGALVALLAFFLPASVLTFATGHLWDRLEGWPWRESIQRGLAPISIGLMLAGTITIAKIAVTDPRTIALALAVTGILLWRKVNPAYLILASAALGWVMLAG
ncbi:chromate transporter [bacterium]|nr:chromate transporter [bacterium]